MEREFKPISEHVIEAAKKGELRKGILEKLFFTGRVLVKEEFENTIAARDEDLTLYAAPELKKKGMIFYRWKNRNIPENDTPHLDRTYYLNLAAKEGFIPISIYDANGKVEN